MSNRILNILAVSGVLCVATSTASAQHHHGGGHHGGGHHGGGHHGGGHVIGHHGSHWGHSNWNYVVPSHGHHGHHRHGTYYVQGGGYYYTPTTVVRPVVYSGMATPAVQQTVMKPVQLEYGSFAQCSDLTGRLEAETNNLCLDLHYNYQANPGFAQLYREAYQIYQEAKHIHASEHVGNQEEIRRRVSDIDRQFHHIQGKLASLNRQHYRQVTEGGVQQKASSVEAILHHLAYTVGVEPHTAEQEVAPPPGGTLEVAPPPAM